MSALEILNVSKSFDVAGRRVEALHQINLAVSEREFVSIVGASGCGKSTLLRLVLGLETEYEGEIRADGRRVTQPGLDRAIVFQEHRLLPWLTVERNVALALHKSGLSGAAKREAVREHLALVGLEGFGKAYPMQLSGGMAQRVAIARALVNRPWFLLLDEPLSGVDALTRLRLQKQIKRIVEQERTTAILVTHDVDEAMYLGDRVVIMHPNPGRIADIVDVPSGQSESRSDLGYVRLRDRILATLDDPGVDDPNKTGIEGLRLAAFG